MYTPRVSFDVFTFQQNSIRNCHEGPSIRGPICVVQPTGERKESREDLRDLTHESEGSKGDQKYRQNASGECQEVGRNRQA